MCLKIFSFCHVWEIESGRVFHKKDSKLQIGERTELVHRAQTLARGGSRLILYLRSQPHSILCGWALGERFSKRFLDYVDSGLPYGKAGL